MKIVGIIAEYNPFHNGHRYQIEQALRITGADAAIVLMSGDFMQRGTPALLPKHLRAQMALQGGASVVLELPVCFSVSSAEFFAHGGISILNALGCVDYLCFGSECGDLELLCRTARILSAEPDGFRTLLQDELKKGLSFPAARRAALESYCEDPLAAGLLDHPNNTLGIEYIKALIRLESPIKPFTVKRQESGYHDTGLAARYSSASAIRHVLQSSSPDFPESTAAFPEAWAETLTGQLPDAALQILSEHYRTRYPAEADDFSLLLKYRLLKETRETLSSYADVTPELANRIYSQRNKLRSWEQFCALLKTREVTYTRISRSLLHILLELTQDEMTDYVRDSSHAYARVLGFCKKDSDILKAIKLHSRIPLITKLTAATELSDAGKRMLALDILAADLYESVITAKYHTPFINEYEQQIRVI